MRDQFTLTAAQKEAMAAKLGWERIQHEMFGAGWRMPDDTFLRLCIWHPDRFRDDCQVLLDWLDKQPNKDELWRAFWADLALDECPVGLADVVRWSLMLPPAAIVRAWMRVMGIEAE